MKDIMSSSLCDRPRAATKLLKKRSVATIVSQTFSRQSPPPDKNSKMKLRSGRAFPSVEPPLDLFQSVLIEDNNQWPNQRQINLLTSKTLDELLLSHAHWLKMYTTSEPSKANRLILLSAAQGFMNSADDPDIQRYTRLIEVLVNKFKDYRPDVLEFNFSEFVTNFRKKFDASFREETRRNYIQKVLAQSLGTDCANTVVNFL